MRRSKKTIDPTWLARKFCREAKKAGILVTGVSTKRVKLPFPLEGMKDYWFPALPVELVDLLAKPGTFGQPVLVGERLAFERRLSAAAASVHGCVGFLRAALVLDEPLLGDGLPSHVVTEIAQYLHSRKLASSQVNTFVNQIVQATNDYGYSCRAFGGYLLMQEAFHKDLQPYVAGAMAKRGHCGWEHVFPHERATLASKPAYQGLPRHETVPFLRKWGLRSIEAPYVFTIDGPLIGASAAEVLMHRGDVPVTAWPSGQPVPERALARSMIESTRKGNVPAHLREWHRLVESDTQNRGQMKRYARLYRAYFMWHAFSTRHPTLLHRNRTRILSYILQFIDKGQQPERTALYRLSRDITRVDGFVEKYAWPNRFRPIVE